MATLAYLIPPVSGLLVFLSGRTERARVHGLQSVAFGALWPLALYGGSAITPGATQVIFVLGGLVWLLLLIGTAVGRDPGLPSASLLRRLARERPRDATEGG